MTPNPRLDIERNTSPTTSSRSFAIWYTRPVTIARQDREENLRVAFALMLENLGDRAMDTTFFSPAQQPFENRILRTTWEELVRQEYIEKVCQDQYRLTPKGWQIGIAITGTLNSSAFQERLGRLSAALKRHVKGRHDSVVVPLQDLAIDSGEDEGWIFNIIDSQADDPDDKRIKARWFEGERGRLVIIPVDFNMRPVDIASSIMKQHLEKIEELEDRLIDVEHDRAQFHCPFCDAPISGVTSEDFPEHHCIVTYEIFECGYVTADGHEQVPCPSGPNWPGLDEFDFVTKKVGNMWTCYAIGKTDRARRVNSIVKHGRTKAGAEEAAKTAAAPKVKKSPLGR